MADNTEFPENLVTCTGKTEALTKQLLHRARKETLSKRKVHTKKPDSNDSNNDSYETSDRNFIADEVVLYLANICFI